MAAYAGTDRYQELIKNSSALAQGKMETAQFEDITRNMFGTAAYVILTIDKVLQAAVKQVGHFRRFVDRVGMADCDNFETADA